MNEKQEITLEEIETSYRSGEWFEGYNLSREQIDWLIGEADLMEYFTPKLNELGDLLRHRVDGRAGDDFISIAIDYITLLEQKLALKE